ncbi:MAG TPA: TIGR00725 family protein [Acidimicrobiales bacterium]|nr:TIGR00725 family protein [Acidimicrobiales bacterium]
MARDAVYVAVSGGGEADDEACRVAEQLGLELARRGAVIVTGGLGGAMAAACRGAKDGGGATIGILPSDDRADANPWVDVAVPTGLGEGRNALVVRAADAVVAVAGEFGTLSEIALALRLGKPVVGLGTWELARDGRPVDAIVVATTPAEAAETAVALARKRRAPPTES